MDAEYGFQPAHLVMAAYMTPTHPTGKSMKVLHSGILLYYLRSSDCSFLLRHRSLPNSSLIIVVFVCFVSFFSFVVVVVVVFLGEGGLVFLVLLIWDAEHLRHILMWTYYFISSSSRQPAFRSGVRDQGSDGIIDPLSSGNSS